jgi:hypothetical protein
MWCDKVQAIWNNSKIVRLIKEHNKLIKCVLLSFHSSAVLGQKLYDKFVKLCHYKLYGWELCETGFSDGLFG